MFKILLFSILLVSISCEGRLRDLDDSIQPTNLISISKPLHSFGLRGLQTGFIEIVGKYSLI